MSDLTGHQVEGVPDLGPRVGDHRLAAAAAVVVVVGQDDWWAVALLSLIY